MANGFWGVAGLGCFRLFLDRDQTIKNKVRLMNDWVGRKLLFPFLISHKEDQVLEIKGLTIPLYGVDLHPHPVSRWCTGTIEIGHRALCCK